MQNLYDLISSGEIGGCYMLHISVHVGRFRISLNSDHFRGKKVSQALQSNGVSSKDLMPLLEVPADYYHQQKASQDPSYDPAHPGAGRIAKEFSLQSVHTSMRNALNPLKRHMIASNGGRWWVFSGGSLERVQSEIQSLQNLRDRLVSDLALVHEHGVKIYKERVANVLSAVGAPPEDYEHYLGEAITMEEIRNNVGFSVEGPIKIPSLQEIADVAPEFRSWMQTTHDNLVQELPKIDAQLCDAMASYLGRLYQLERAELKAKKAQMMADDYQVIGNLIQIRQQLIRINDQLQNDAMSVLQITLQSFPDDESRRRRLREVQQALLSRQYLALPTSQGHKNLASWCGVVNTDDRFAALQALIKQARQKSTPADQKQELLLKIRAEHRALTESTDRRLASVDKAVTALLGDDLETEPQPVAVSEDIEGALPSDESEPERKPRRRSATAQVVERTESVAPASPAPATVSSRPKSASVHRTVKLAGF